MRMRVCPCARVMPPAFPARSDMMSALPPKADMCSATAHVCFGPIADIETLFDHLVGATLHRPRHGNAERLGGPEVDDQLHFRNLLYWQVCRIFTLENAAGVDARLPPSMREIRAIAH